MSSGEIGVFRLDTFAYRAHITSSALGDASQDFPVSPGQPKRCSAFRCTRSDENQIVVGLSPHLGHQVVLDVRLPTFLMGEGKDQPLSTVGRRGTVLPDWLTLPGSLSLVIPPDLYSQYCRLPPTSRKCLLRVSSRSPEPRAFELELPGNGAVPVLPPGKRDERDPFPSRSKKV